MHQHPELRTTDSMCRCVGPEHNSIYTQWPWVEPVLTREPNGVVVVGTPQGGGGGSSCKCRWGREVGLRSWDLCFKACVPWSILGMQDNSTCMHFTLVCFYGRISPKQKRNQEGKNHRRVQTILLPSAGHLEEGPITVPVVPCSALWWWLHSTRKQLDCTVHNPAAVACRAIPCIYR